MTYPHFLSRLSLTRLLRLFMSGPRPDLPDVFPHGTTTTVAVHDWARRIQDIGTEIDCCLVQEIKYCKCIADRKEHEFLVIRIRYQADVAHENYLTVDRCPESSPESQRSSSDEVMRGSKIASSRPVAADDCVVLSKDGTERCVTERQGKFQVIAVMTFKPPKAPNLVTLATLFNVVSKHAPNYHIKHNQCYWFAFTVWQVMAPWASNIQETANWSSRGTYSGRSWGDGVSSVAIQNEFQVALVEVMEKAKVKEVERCAVEEQVTNLSYRRLVLCLIACVAATERPARRLPGGPTRAGGRGPGTSTQTC
jgi:hypothetical protein